MISSRNASPSPPWSSEPIGSHQFFVSRIAVRASLLFASVLQVIYTRPAPCRGDALNPLICPVCGYRRSATSPPSLGAPTSRHPPSPQRQRGDRVISRNQQSTLYLQLYTDPACQFLRRLGQNEGESRFYPRSHGDRSKTRRSYIPPVAVTHLSLSRSSSYLFPILKMSRAR